MPLRMGTHSPPSVLDLPHGEGLSRPISPLSSASSFVPQEYLKLLTPQELAIVVSVVQQVLDGQLPKSYIAEVCSGLNCVEHGTR
jgi:hypothetical protein